MWGQMVRAVPRSRRSSARGWPSDALPLHTQVRRDAHGQHTAAHPLRTTWHACTTPLVLQLGGTELACSWMERVGMVTALHTTQPARIPAAPPRSHHYGRVSDAQDQPRLDRGHADQCWLGASLVYAVQQQGPTIFFVEQQPPLPCRCSGCLNWSARARGSSGNGAWRQRRRSSRSLAVPACVRHASGARLRLCCLSRVSRRCAPAGRGDCMAPTHNILERQLHRVALSRC